MKLLLHCCCAPCSVSCVNTLSGEGIDLQLFWYNPNIHPFIEYKSRRDCLIEFANSENLTLINNDEYNLRFFLDEVLSEPDADPADSLRCERCYRIRLEKTASLAAQHGFKAFSTTLLISPYQKHEEIKKIGQKTADKYGIEFLYRDFRPFFREGQSAARAKNMYMQKYCGCVFSQEEIQTPFFPQSSNSPKKESSLAPQSIKPLPESSTLLCGDIFDRVKLITGEEGLKKLSETHVLVFGAGGVGSWAAEALVRSGIGKIGIIDNDFICASNINRQIEATTLTVGQPKASALKKRLLEINPNCKIVSWDNLFCRENSKDFNLKSADYVIDAIDTLNHKLDLIEAVINAGVTLFSSMGMALKTDPSMLKIASVWKTEACPLARLVRQGLRKRGFLCDFTVVYSSESPANLKSKNSPVAFPSAANPTDVSMKKQVNGSMVTVTGSAGFMLASLVLRDILK
jgi:hypothetical protein